MGSGCIERSVMEHCAQVLPATCIKYQGPSIPDLQICSGDSLDEISKQILETILQMLQGKNITLPDIAINCQYLLSKLAGRDKTLANLLQLLLTVACEYKSMIDDIYQRIMPSGDHFTFDLQCIPPPVEELSTASILQAVIRAHCSLRSQVDTLIEQSGSTTIINHVVQQALSDLIKGLGNYGLQKQVTGNKVSYLFTGLIPPRTALPYFGPLSNFDNTGKGLDAAGFSGWYLCNGNNGTPDLRGVTLVGAIQGVGGPALPAHVDPVANQDPTMNYSIGQGGGVAKVTLAASQMPVHTHPLNDPGHNHAYDYPTPEKFSGSKFDSATQKNRQTEWTTKAFTGITIGNAGGGQPHENRMPYSPCAFIMRFD